ncbi:N-acetylglucosaminyldiphosphoundecaprenol N-acetyl-beta-D-mannosaminyltransferase [Actinomadura pelletieri DSM 43383]|uniref:N-acetylglucosaminyldiphosphoundecaprenol N-acetyl-beta-D-mannosaminyltransferase n=1 Tax=Actinomadura pelletieri DSM 43383 TaxID=1120940 RepID=A0A495QJ94_9ACTN|nr:WecB/TagA/CpsF family glycosyltransferase [Actinomadura pelletieri]RKS72064.1 N-acetylglucosaminyldiphosphoundecaprenol N-acetyl-beta-D-mannosaminyltransferase [Actinomadura pelletieri DSM 43383]
MDQRWPHDTVDVLGVRISRTGVAQFRSFVERAVKDRTKLTVTFANPDYVLKAQKDHELRALMNAFDLNLPDGWGVVLAARIFGRPVPGRMANDDLTDDLFGQPAEHGWRVFLFGNAPGVADEAAENVRKWFPGLEIAGTRHGHWADETGRIPAATAERLVAEINDAAPDILHVGLGTPLQQRFVIEYRDRLTAPVVITCGAYFEHLAERRDYYPAWVLKLRVGFLYRLAREPRRLWRRYTVELGSYLVRVTVARIRQGKSRME